MGAHLAQNKMNGQPVCVECGKKQEQLFIQYGKDNIKLIKCTSCGNFADKYLENDFVVIFLDMMLQKSQVYRHILLNRDWKRSEGEDMRTFVFKLGILLILFEVYVKWSKLDKSQQAQWIESSDQKGNTPVAMLEQYLYMLFLCTFEFLFWHIGIWIGSMGLLYKRFSFNELERISLGIVLSSFGKLLLIAMAIWNFSDLEHSWLINVIVLASNSVALSVLLRQSKWNTFLILLVGLGFKLSIQLLCASLDARLAILLF